MKPELGPVEHDLQGQFRDIHDLNKEEATAERRMERSMQRALELLKLSEQMFNDETTSAIERHQRKVDQN